MDSSRILLAFGRFRHERQRELRVAATEAGLTLETHDDRHLARDALELDPAVVLVDADSPHAESFVLDVRGDLHRAELPILMLAPTIGDLAFADAFAVGVDDVVPCDQMRGLVRRLRAVPRERCPRSDPSRGRALLAEPDGRRRSAIGRLLRSAGYGVTFAATSDDAYAYASHSDFALVVASSELVPDQRAAIELARSLGSRAAWITSAPPRQLKPMRTALAGLSGVSVIDAFASPDAVLFASNELSSARGADQRKSPRVLYGACVAFRGAGREEDDHGFSYNVSEGGLFVRTLAPPEDDIVWLELAPPRGERRVRLVGNVVWRRAFGGQAHATVPAGFGVEIKDGARADLDAWLSGCRALVESTT